MATIDENKYTFEMVAQILREYKDLKRKAMQLEFEITHFAPIASDNDIIDAMTFSKLEGGAVNFVHNGNAADKTAKIAVSYAEQSDRLNKKHKRELESDLRSTNIELLRIEYYVGLLDKKHAKALRLLYFEGLTYLSAAENAKLSPDTVKKQRKAGINKLVEMYNNIVI